MEDLKTIVFPIMEVLLAMQNNDYPSSTPRNFTKTQHNQE